MTIATSSQHRYTAVFMDTFVSVRVISEEPDCRVRRAAERAFNWFSEVERVCSRFDPSSEVMELAGRPGEPVEVSTVLFELTRFAVELARLTRGAFDPTQGTVLATRGFDRNYLTGERVGYGTH